MITQTYEHHLELKRDKLCPFKFKTCEDVYNTVCNWHRNIEILLVTDGKGRIQYGSEDFAIETHDVIIINSGALHRVYSKSGVSFTYVLIDESFAVENGMEINSRIFEKAVRSEMLESQYLKAHKCFDEHKTAPSSINTAKARCSMLSLMIELCEKHTTQAASYSQLHTVSEKYVKQTLEYLGDHCTEPIVLEDVASICGITKYHLARIFKEYTGQTMLTYVNILRCKKAEHCISAGMSVTEAAQECGFESTSYFSRTYKRLMGHSPSSEKEK